jgi:hypothetical protein
MEEGEVPGMGDGSDAPVPAQDDEPDVPVTFAG